MFKTIAFYGNCAAQSESTLVSQRVSTPFRLVDITTTFPAGCVNLLQVSFFTAPDDHAPASGLPSGVSILQDYGQVDYVVGEAQKKVIRHTVVVDESGAYLKARGVNNDYYDHAIDVQMTIEVDG